MTKYLHPELTAAFGIAVVPDAVYDLCGATLCDTFKMNVVVVSYGMFIPYLLLVFQTVLKTAQNIDLEKLEHALSEVEKSIQEAQGELEGSFSRGMTQIGNSKNKVANYLGRAGSRLGGIRTSQAALPTPDAPRLHFVPAELG